MRTIQKQVSIAANTTDRNILTDEIFEFMDADGLVTVGLTSDTAAAHFATMKIGAEIVADDIELKNTGAFPVIPDDIIVQAGAAAGDKLTLSVRNNTAAAHVVFLLLQVS